MPIGLLLLLSAAPVDNPDLKKGEELFAQYKYAEARTAMTKARAARGLDRATLIRILEVIGISAGQQRQAAPAQAAFKDLLYLAPNHQFDTEFAPRVMTPYFEARGQVIEGGGALQFTADTERATVVVKDRLQLGKVVRFHSRAGAAPWAVADVVPTNGKATLPGAPTDVSWWAELLGDNETQLALVGTEAAPQVERPPQAVAAAPTPPPAPPPEVVAPVMKTSALRPVSYGVLAAAAVAGGVGAYFGVTSSSAFSQLRTAARDGSGRVTSLTEKQAYELSASGRQSGTIANALFIGAGALGVTAVVLWFAGAPVAVAPAPNGVLVSGRFP